MSLNRWSACLAFRKLWVHKLNMMAHTCNPSTQEAEEGGSLSSRSSLAAQQVQGQLGIRRYPAPETKGPRLLPEANKEYASLGTLSIERDYLVLDVSFTFSVIQMRVCLNLSRIMWVLGSDP